MREENASQGVTGTSRSLVYVTLPVRVRQMLTQVQVQPIMGVRVKMERGEKVEV